ncbi:MAG: TonB-dependent receptor [Porticoccaceae bacterium]|nr:TonB-dependent receptor [Porticoccaceae bacterium]
MTYFKKVSVLAVAISGAIASVQPAFAQGGAAAELEEVVVMGSRSNKPRSATESTVPVDVFSEAELNAFGNQADITDTLKALVPSYTATPATGDGSAFIRPTSLRGMAPDQALVLVNGKRRHRSALVQFFAPAAGNGAHGVDVAMIPGIALKNIEVLRDGAAAQYGSDAIAGVMNLQLKDASEGGQIQVQYGEFFEGEQSTRVSANGGFAIGDNGFLNVSFESVDNDALSRGVQRPVAQGLIDAGVTGVGADSPFGDAPFVQTWGRPETSGDRLFFNSGFDLDNGGEAYMHGGYAETDGRYRFFYRAGYDSDCSTGHSTIKALCQDPDWVAGTLRQGYTPYLDGAQTDKSLVAGIKGEMDSGISYDISVGTGINELRYVLNNTTAPNQGVAADGSFQRDFDLGGYDQEETNINADFNKALTENVNLAFGMEWREETFTTLSGEQAAIDGNTSGMSTAQPEAAGEFSRDNIAFYADLERDISDDLLVQYALRYEDFSDFGSTTNYKVAGRYTVNDSLTLRGSMSTGFHAPTPGQANVSTIITTFDGTTGLQVEEGLVPSTSAAAVAVGGAPLKEEESVNLSLGFTSQIGDNTTLTFDMYHIEVDDRIYRTGDIETEVGGSISFYTNAMDVEHQGFDLVLSSSFELISGMETVASLAYNHNSIDVTGQKTINGVKPVSDSLVEDIENNYPEDRWVLNTMTNINDKLSLMARLNFYGEHYDERGTIGADTNPSAEIDSIIYMDIELGYDVSENLRITAGGSNIFDEYVDEIGAPNANRMSVGLQYPRRTAANYEGGSWYLRANYSF